MRRNTEYKNKETFLVSEIQRYLNAGKTGVQISSILGISKIKIIRLKKKYKIVNIHSRKSSNPFNGRDELVELYKKYTMKEIANQKKISTNTVKRWFNEYGIQVLNRHKQFAKHNNTILPTAKQIVDDYNEGLLIGECAKKYNITVRILRTLFEQNNINLNWKKTHGNTNRKIKKFYPMPESANIILNDIETIKKLYPSDKFTHITIAKTLEVSPITVRKRLKKLGIDKDYKPVSNRSSYEVEICTLLDSLNIKYNINDRNIVSGYECDIYLPQLKFGIEFNGTYWHSEKQKNKLYHIEKFKAFKDVGVSLYQIFEYDWNNNKDVIIKDLSSKIIKNRQTIYARKTIIKEISSQEYKQFCIENHIQGYSVASIKLGLYHNNSLVSIMSFGKSRFDKSAEYELIRYSTNSNVIGGPEKLFSYFIKKYTPKSIISYSLNDRGYSNFYLKLGFSFSHYSSPNYKWVNGSDIKTRYQCQKHKLLGCVTTEDDYMQSLKYLKIYDSGNSVYKYIHN